MVLRLWVVACVVLGVSGAVTSVRNWRALRPLTVNVPPEAARSSVRCGYRMRRPAHVVVTHPMGRVVVSGGRVWIGDPIGGRRGYALDPASLEISADLSRSRWRLTDSKLSIELYVRDSARFQHMLDAAAIRYDLGLT